MSGFLSALVMAPLVTPEGHDTNIWVLREALIYDSDAAKRVITVPAGFLTDLASTPRAPIIYELFGNVAPRAAVVHDYLYTSGRESRAVADAVLREACALTGMSGWRRWGMWAGVRLGGFARYTSTPAGSPTEDPKALPAAIDNVLF